MLTRIALLFAALAVLAAVGVYMAFLRPAFVTMAAATLTGKTFAPAHTMSRYQTSSAATRQSWAKETFTIPDSYVFDLQIEGLPQAARYSLEKSAGERFRVGQRVTVRYQVRGIPPLWKRILVLEIATADQDK